MQGERLKRTMVWLLQPFIARPRCFAIATTGPNVPAAPTLIDEAP
jgi:hypothetical protein